MLLSYSVENWKSFQTKQTFSMVASRERQHGERLRSLSKFRTRVLPVSAIFGGNASGKTNFISSVQFLKELVVLGRSIDSKMSVQWFRLDPSYADRPTRFELMVLAGKRVFGYAVELSNTQVLEERLWEEMAAGEKLIFSRKADADEITFGPNVSDVAFLKHVAQGTRSNQLFLTNAASQQVEDVWPVFDWFRNTLAVVSLDAMYNPILKLLDGESPSSKLFKDLFTSVDTGMSSLELEPLSLDSLNLEPGFLASLEQQIEEGASRRYGLHNEVLVSRKNGELVAHKMVSYHLGRNGERVKFDLGQESSGSRRVLELLPAFLHLGEANSKKVFLIDELDRSIHTALTRELLGLFLSSATSDSNSQLIFTTHDLQLMDQKLLRRDEMWVTERDEFGASTMRSFGDYTDARYDKDIRKSYQQGRMGGIPRLRL